MGSLCTVYGEKISNLNTTPSVVPDFSEDARNMVGQRTVSVVRVFGQCSEKALLKYIWIAEFRATAAVEQILIEEAGCTSMHLKVKVF